MIQYNQSMVIEIKRTRETTGTTQSRFGEEFQETEVTFLVAFKQMDRWMEINQMKKNMT